MRKQQYILNSRPYGPRNYTKHIQCNSRDFLFYIENNAKFEKIFEKKLIKKNWKKNNMKNFLKKNRQKYFRVKNFFQKKNRKKISPQLFDGFRDTKNDPVGPRSLKWKLSEYIFLTEDDDDDDEDRFSF